MNKTAPAERQGVLLGRGACNLDDGLPGHAVLAVAGAFLRSNGHQSVSHHQVVLEALTLALINTIGMGEGGGGGGVFCYDWP